MSIHRLKIVLSGVKPQVWRRIEVDSSVHLPTLSSILLTAMGWYDSHLHLFVTGDASYGIKDPDFSDDDFDDLDEEDFTLAQIAPRAKDRFRYEYDFGDGWEHRVTVEAITEAVPGMKYPRCTDGANACPPEDCGGPYGYADLLKALADPNHEEHESFKEWMGDQEFDPTDFSLDAVNLELQFDEKQALA